MQKIIALFCFLFVSQGFGKTVVISDIDDTIRSLHCQGSYLEMYDNSVDPNRAFRGMSEIYQDLNSSGVKIHYVTAAIGMFVADSVNFLSTNQFPQVDNYSYKGVFEDTYDYKVWQIEEILNAENADSIILIGDNGDRDVDVYATIASKYANVKTYIHKLYPGTISAGQNIYLTGADLAVQFEALGILSDMQVGQILKNIVQDVQGADEYIFEMVWPNWAEVTPEEVELAFSFSSTSSENQQNKDLVKSLLFL